MANQPVRKIMLVEDDPSMQSLLRTLLELEGFQVSVPGNKPEAELLSAIRKEQPDVILLDVNLREVSGIELLRKLRGGGEASQTRVIMTSGMDVKDESMQAGANDFLMKPYMPSELIRKLRG